MSAKTTEHIPRSLPSLYIALPRDLADARRLQELQCNKNARILNVEAHVCAEVVHCGLDGKCVVCVVIVSCGQDAPNVSSPVAATGAQWERL